MHGNKHFSIRRNESNVINIGSCKITLACAIHSSNKIAILFQHRHYYRMTKENDAQASMR